MTVDSYSGNGKHATQQPERVYKITCGVSRVSTKIQTR